MKTLKQLSKITLKITLILFFSNCSFANEPIDIWKIEKKDIINKENSTSNINASNNLNTNTALSVQSSSEILINKEIESSTIKLAGLYDPAQNGLKIDMWSNSDGELIKSILNKNLNRNLSEFSKKILDIALLTNSYIPTNNATATRGGDTLIVDNIEDEIGYNQNEGTVIMDFSYTQDSDGAQTLFTLSGTSSNATDSGVRQWLRINQSAGTPNTIRYVQNSNDSDSSATVTPGVFQKIAFAYEAGDQDVSLDGTSILDTARTPSTNIFRLVIGSIGWNLGLTSVSLKGHVKRFTYYPKKLPNSQLNTLTS